MNVKVFIQLVFLHVAAQLHHVTFPLTHPKYTTLFRCTNGYTPFHTEYIQFYLGVQRFILLLKFAISTHLFFGFTILK